MTIIDKLQDLLKQATTERSHYYVASVVRESIAEIVALYKQLVTRDAQIGDLIQKVKALTDELNVIATASAEMLEDQAKCYERRIKELEAEYINKPPGEREICKGCFYPAKVNELESANAKYKAFWEDSRMADKMSWEQYDWPKHQKEDSQ